MILKKNTKDDFYDFLINNQEKFYRLAFSYVKNKEAALDAVQDAVANALSNYSSLREPSYMKTWFYRILVNSSINYIRNDSKYLLIDDFAVFEEETCFEKENVDNIDLYDAILTLPLNLKTVIVLRYFEDMKISQIAEIMESPESTVKTRLKSALEKLSKII